MIETVPHVIVEPDIWTKLTAIGTIGAVVSAVFLAAWAGLAARRAAKQQDDREARTEARKVVLLTGHDEDLSPSDYGKGQVLVVSEYVEVTNAGSEPIVEARMIWGGSDRGNDTMTDWQWMHGVSYQPLVLAGKSARFGGFWQAVGPGDQPQLSNADRGGLFVVVGWSDARNRHWLKRGRSEPVELMEPASYGKDLNPRHRADRKSQVVHETEHLWATDRRPLA